MHLGFSMAPREMSRVWWLPEDGPFEEGSAEHRHQRVVGREASSSNSSHASAWHAKFTRKAVAVVGYRTLHMRIRRPLRSSSSRDPGCNPEATPKAIEMAWQLGRLMGCDCQQGPTDQWMRWNSGGCRSGVSWLSYAPSTTPKLLPRSMSEIGSRRRDGRRGQAVFPRSWPPAGAGHVVDVSFGLVPIRHSNPRCPGLTGQRFVRFGREFDTRRWSLEFGAEASHMQCSREQVFFCPWGGLPPALNLS